MNSKDNQEIFEFFTDNLAKASQEFQNKIKESQFYQAMKEEMEKYLRIPVAEFPSLQWFEDNGWKLRDEDRPVKNKFEVSGLGYDFQITKEVGLGSYEAVFKGTLLNEEEFKTVCKFVGI